MKKLLAKKSFSSPPAFLNENDKEMIWTERWVTAFKPLRTFYSLKSQHQWTEEEEENIFSVNCLVNFISVYKNHYEIPMPMMSMWLPLHPSESAYNDPTYIGQVTQAC